ncbi:Hypothetical protein Cul210931_2060 [Corynebacterium ulcerans]|nr:Hypothetical protein Cul210931_2060 [Corynebacterium ulcerans]
MRAHPYFIRLGSILGIVAIQAEVLGLSLVNSGLIVGHGFTVALKGSVFACVRDSVVPSPSFRHGQVSPYTRRLVAVNKNACH